MFVIRTEVMESLVGFALRVRFQQRCLKSARHDRNEVGSEMHVYHDQLEVHTHGKRLYEITDEVQSKIDKCKVQNGTVTVFVQHTSCSIVIMENADSTARGDLEQFFERLVPENADYFMHDSEGSDDMPSHIRMVLTHTSETVPIASGKMQLGTWQGIFLFEHRRAPHRRRILITTIGE
jgi:secondary thiamine-phosphate synthase enzyme